MAEGSWYIRGTRRKQFTKPTPQFILSLNTYLEELEVLEDEGLVGHGDLLVEADLDAGHDGHGGAEPAEEEDDDQRPHPPLHQEGRVQVLEHLVEDINSLLINYD